MLRHLTLAVSALLAATFVACGDSARTVDVRTTSTPAATVELGPAQPEVGRIEEHIRVFAEEIGIREGGSPEEEAAIAYAREQLESWGYEVEVQTFRVAGPEVLRYATLTIEGPEPVELRAVAFDGAAAGQVTGQLSDAGIGLAEGFPADAADGIVLIQRDSVTFTDMAQRAADAGAVAVVVANRDPELFPGVIDPPASLPVVAVDEEDGELLRELLSAGPVEVTVSIRSAIDARNVVARPDGSPCRTVSGGHYDSIPWTAGANDNASGSAMVLELARVAAAAGLSGHCFVLFGAEETGLNGSAFFVSSLSEEEREGLVAMYNYDAIGGGGGIQLIGSGEIVANAQAIARELALEVERASLPENATSDHANFEAAGIPALMFSTPSFIRIHTAQDTAANLNAASLDEIAEIGFALLQELG